MMRPEMAPQKNAPRKYSVHGNAPVLYESTGAFLHLELWRFSYHLAAQPVVERR